VREATADRSALNRALWDSGAVLVVCPAANCHCRVLSSSLMGPDSDSLRLARIQVRRCGRRVRIVACLVNRPSSCRCRLSQSATADSDNRRFAVIPSPQLRPQALATLAASMFRVGRPLAFRVKCEHASRTILWLGDTRICLTVSALSCSEANPASNRHLLRSEQT
jgi:hypothetical protein